MHGEAEHLGQMTHRRLAAVVLPVGVGDETHRRVEGEVRRDGVEAARVQRQKALQPLDGVERQESGDGKDDHRDRIGEPVLLAGRVHPGQAVKAALDRSEDGSEEASFARVYAGNEFAERNGAANDQNERQRDLRPAYKRHRITFLI